MAKRRDGSVAETEVLATAKPTGEILPVRKQRVFAGPCPRAAAHTQTRVYRTAGRTRYCVCDSCGHTWKQVGEAAGTS